MKTLFVALVEVVAFIATAPVRAQDVAVPAQAGAAAGRRRELCLNRFTPDTQIYAGISTRF